MRKKLLIISFVLFCSSELSACSCSSAWNDSFSRTAKTSEFVTLVKILSYDKYLENEIMGFDGSMPYSMTAEIIKKFRGKESRKTITILGDNGILCRPYLSDFEINGYYLVSPIPMDNSANTEYFFSSCRTDYLKVNIQTNKAHGKYSLIRNQIDIKTFESKLENGDWDLAKVGLLGILLILMFSIFRRNKKRNANNVFHE